MHKFNRFGHLGQRFCARCGAALTDAASLECGIGPTCGHLDNALLAKHIASNVPLARQSMVKVDFAHFPPETVPTWLKVEAALVAEGAEEVQDWRETVKRVEWLLSHSVQDPTRSYLMGMVFGLGYIGIVSLWKGEAATGLASCWFDTGRIYISGPQNKAARMAFQKVMGCKAHGMGYGYVPPVEHKGEKVKAWSFPADKWEQVRKAVWTHYPNHENLLGATETAQAYLLAVESEKAKQVQMFPAAEVVAVPVTPAPTLLPPASTSGAFASLAENGWLMLKTPGYKAAFVAAIKEIPGKDRKWSFTDTTWMVAPGHKEKALSIFTKAWPDANVAAVQ
jgi:hypothetical protein